MTSIYPENEDSVQLYEKTFNWVYFEEDFAEYHNAKRRFDSINYYNTMCASEDELHLDYLIWKLCGDEEIELRNDESLFFRLLFRADFLQLSEKVKPKFYRRICLFFILTSNIVYIVASMDNLNMIQHVKIDIFLNLMKVLNLGIKIEHKCLTLNFASRRSWYDMNSLNAVDQVIISPAAFKLILAKHNLNFYHLNFIFRLFRIEELTLDDCNLNWKEEGNILDGLILKTLRMSNCGTSVNRIIYENFENLKENLTELNISGCPLYNATLKLLAQIKLNRLNIRDCIKKSGYFIEDIWMELKCFGTSQKSNTDINILWEDGDLSTSLKSLDASFNDIIFIDLEAILRLNLSVLNLSSTNGIWTSDFVSLLLNTGQNLKELRIRDVEIDFTLLATIFELRLKVFEFTYDSVKMFNDFSALLKAPMAESLQELTIDLKNHTQPFVHFLSHLKLTYFECKLGTWYYYNFDLFWNHKHRKYLKRLILEDGKISETDALGISALRLEVLSLFPFLFDCKEHILTILSSDILHRSVIDLRLGGAYEVDSDYLYSLTKFRKLIKLSLKISGINLSKIFSNTSEYFKSLRELKLKVYIGLNVDEQAANVLCNLPTGTLLTMVLVGLGKKWPLSFTQQASHVFSMKRFLYESDIPVQLELSDCTLDFRCGKIFSHFNIESLVLNSCVLENFLCSFLEGNIVFTLKFLIMKRVDVDNRQLEMLRNLCLHELSILTSVDNFGYNELPIILSDGPISKSLSILRLGPYSCMPYIEHILKSKISVYQLYPSYLL